MKVYHLLPSMKKQGLAVHFITELAMGCVRSSCLTNSIVFLRHGVPRIIQT